MSALPTRSNSFPGQAQTFRFMFRALLVCNLLSVFLDVALAQTKGKGKTGEAVSTTSSSSGKRSGGKGKTGEAVIPNAAPKEDVKPVQGRTTYIPVIKKVPVPVTEGYLALFTVPQSRAELRLVSGANDAGKPLQSGQANKEGLVNFPKLAPGKYRLDVTCEDYEPFTDIIVIEKGRQTARIASLASKFATLRIGLGKQAGKDISVKLNGQPFDQPEIEQNELVFDRVPVGKQTFTISKPGYRDWVKEIEIRSGNNSLSETMEEATIAVTIKTESRAEIYLDNDPKREAEENGEMTLNLPPGVRKLRVELAGYETARQELNLLPEPRTLTVPIPLTAIADDADFDERFDPGQKTWTPFPPAGWQFQNTKPLGLRITGESPAFVFSTTLPNRQFNIYRDFDMLINVRLAKGKGLAWIVRAKDEKNYYLFELDRERKTLTFYICKNGILSRPIRQDDTVVNLDDTERFYRIKLAVRGNTFTHTIGGTPFGGIFEDNNKTFGLGGVGLRSFTGAEVVINQFAILKPENKRLN